MHDLHFHDLRHTAATWLIQASVEYATVEKPLGHKLPGMGEQSRLESQAARDGSSGNGGAAP
ncbi:MAG: tyrosine-type recombinase/integrase [Nitrospira sp.]|nr:tyrosine-type recombinase/integrase [Nitrospira sp.]